MSSGGVCHYCRLRDCICDDPEEFRTPETETESQNLNESEAAAAEEEEAEVNLNFRQAAICMTVLLDGVSDAKALSNRLAIGFFDPVSEEYTASHPQIRECRVDAWKIAPQKNEQGEIIQPEPRVTAYVLEIEASFFTSLSETDLRTVFGVSFATPDGIMLGETDREEKNSIVEYAETLISVVPAEAV